MTFTGGEPLLASSLLRRAVSYVEQASGVERRIRWHLLTNGILLNEETVAFLDAHGFTINLSFDGVPAAQAFRGRATHSQLDRLLVRLQHTHPALFRERLKVCLTLSPAAIPYLSDSVSYFIENGVWTFDITPVFGNLEWRLDRIDELAAQFEAVSTTILRHYQRTGEVPLVLFRKSIPESDARPVEWACRVANGRSVVVDVDGNIYACLLASRTYQSSPAPMMQAPIEALSLGSADAPDFVKRLAMVGEAARATGAFRHAEGRHSSYGKCTDCEFLSRCRICPLAGVSIRDLTDVYRVSDFLCAFNQVALAHRDRFPCQPTAYDFLSGKVPLSALRLRRGAVSIDNFNLTSAQAAR